ncbi:MAG: radical SAM protein [Parasporobacterium sp.]|nr:radical SAM protein [Parasporobacterium sp.]
MMKLQHMIYLPLWFVRNVIFRKHGPLQTVLFITDYCNLKCRHCFEMGHACTMQKSYRQIESELRDCYRMGSRFVDFEGGEPTLWRQNAGEDTPQKGVDGWKDSAGREQLNINDLILLAKKIGFYSCTVTTNAQKDFSWVNADLIWMSLDGYRQTHDQIRGQGAFEKLDQNARIFAEMQQRRRQLKEHVCTLGCNMAVNRINAGSVRDTLEYVKNSLYIESIAVNFHTPYPGTEDLMLPDPDRARIIDEVISLKKQHYPIQNSISGLKTMKRRGFKKDCWISNFILTDGTWFRACPGETLGICDDCGFCMAGEMYSVLHLKPDTLLAGLSLRL